MTRLAIISDIHGNLTALNAVLEDISTFKVDRIVVAGDVVNWGPHNVEVMERVVSEGWAVIRGNQELYVLDQDTVRAPAVWNDYTVARWTRGQLGGRWLNVIATWPDSLTLRFPDAPNMRVVHGSPRSHFEGIYVSASDEQISEILNGVEEETVISGHTHLPMDRQSGRWHILNTGSVGMPIAGLMESTYLILDGNWDGWHATQCRIPFDPTPVLRDFEQLGFVEFCGATGALVLEEYRTSRLHVVPFLTWRKQFPDETEDKLLARFTREIDPWEYTPTEYHVNKDLTN